jgi:hypothetical protein
MRKLTCALIFMAVMVGAMVFVGDVHASTLVGGSINSNTTWAKASSPYMPMGIITSISEVNLTIQQGNINELTPTPSPAPTATPTPSPLPTPSPTPKIMPGSPLSLGGSTFAETISQFDLMGLAKLVLIALGIMWVIIILSSVDRKFGKKDNKKP